MSKVKLFAVTLVFALLIVGVLFTPALRTTYLPTSSHSLSTPVVVSSPTDAKKSSLTSRLFGGLRKKKTFEFVLPDVNGSVPTEIKSDFQWEDHLSKFVLVSTQNVTTFVSPIYDKKAYMAHTLNFGQRVQVTYIDPKLVKVDSKLTKWVFIQDPYTKEPLGWALNRDLLYKNSFAKPSRLPFLSFSFCLGQFCGTVETKGSLFSLKWDAKGQGLYFSGTEQGRVLQKGSLLWFNDPDSLVIDKFFILDRGVLRHEPRYENATLTDITIEEF